MTREEAIAVLEKEASIIDDNSIEMTAREWDEFDDLKRDAIPVAIEALSEDTKGYSTMSEEYDKAIESLSDEVDCSTCRHNDKEWYSVECDSCCGNNSHYEPSDLISRADAIKTMCEACLSDGSLCTGSCYTKRALINMTSAETVQVVLCKDCRYWQDAEEGIVECPICTRLHDMVIEMGADGFCSKGERRKP